MVDATLERLRLEHVPEEMLQLTIGGRSSSFEMIYKERICLD
jgi:hypothetical protein